MAYSYYDKKDYYRASVLLEEVIPLLKGTAEAEKAQFYYAFTQYELRMLEMSAYLFKNFRETFPRSIYSEEAAFMEVLSYFENTPKYYLDQGNTQKTIYGIEAFMREFPESEHREKAQRMVNILQEKLETKAFENAKLYYKIMDYKAAIIALGNYIKEYPYSPNTEEAQYLRMVSSYKLAKISTESKQLERYAQAIEFYYKFVDKYPKSKLLRSAENYFELAQNQVNKLKNKS
jgi:outer membrane protein assembly factor BamD